MTEWETSDPECQQLGPALSALIDGELAGTEKSAVAQHLISCDACRQRVRAFETVNQSILKRGEAPRVSPARSRWPGHFRFAAPLAAAALLLVGVLINWPQTPPAEPETLTAEEMLRPIQQIHQISQQREHDQTLMLQTMELNLRTMQLELEQLPPGDPQRAVMQQRLDSLMGRVLENQFTFAMDDL